MGVESPLSRSAENDGVALVVRLKVLPLNVPVAVAVAPSAVAGSAANPAPTSNVTKSFLHCIDLPFFEGLSEEIPGLIGAGLLRL